MRAGVGAVWTLGRTLRFLAELVLALALLEAERCAVDLAAAVWGAANAGAVTPAAANNTTAAVIFGIRCAPMFPDRTGLAAAQRDD
jgi:hypothetical protein